MIILTIVLGCLTLYFTMGTIRAQRRLPVTWAKARKAWTYEDQVRGAVRGMTVWTFFMWPGVWVYDKLSPKLDAFVDTGDPKALERQAKEKDELIKKQRRYIRRLEIENNIPPTEVP